MRKCLPLRELLLVLTLFVAVVLPKSRASEPQDEEDAYGKVAVLTRVLQLIRQDYVDDQKVSYKDLTYAALRGMLSSLDPHSEFMDPDEFKAMQDDTKSEFGGVGVVLSIRDGTLSIATAMEDAPGFKAGLLPGDQIVKINNSATERMDIPEASSQLRGKPGESVALTIFRPSTKEFKDFVIQRAIIKVESVKDAKLLSSELTGEYKVGYVRITQFNEPTAQELAKKLDQLKGMDALILDLRYNPGGLMTSAVDVCAQFLPPNQLVVYTEGRVPSQKKVYKTPEGMKQRAYFPMAILINGSSASGAEIVAGALKDLKRAILVGETTFGKGSVQSVVKLQDDSAVRLTTAKYYTPSQQTIHERGVTPNIRATLSSEQERQLLQARRESIENPKGETLGFRDPQLERAVDALKGIMIYAQASGKTPPKKNPEQTQTAEVVR